MSVEITLMIGGQPLQAVLDDDAVAAIAATITPTHAPEPVSPWLTIKHAAVYLGLTEPAVRKLIDRGRIPKYQPSGKRGRILLHVNDLDAYLQDEDGNRAR